MFFGERRTRLCINWCFVMQFDVPHRVQYETLRLNFDQEVKIKYWNIGFFKFCKPDTEHKKCSLGEYCECARIKEMFSHFVDEDLTAEEERAMHLEIELKHLKRKHGDDFMKYYPYHLDKNYDDENGEPYDYGFGNNEDDEEDEADNWWKK